MKLVEKALPASEEDQIRSQDSLKRSLEISAGLFGMCQYFRNLHLQEGPGKGVFNVRISVSRKNYRQCLEMFKKFKIQFRVRPVLSRTELGFLLAF